jgi:hypothetical protein
MSAGRRFGRDLELEESLAAWLAEGPEIAPTTVVDDAIEAVDRRLADPGAGCRSDRAMSWSGRGPARRPGDWPGRHSSRPRCCWRAHGPPWS